MIDYESLEEEVFSEIALLRNTYAIDRATRIPEYQAAISRKLYSFQDEEDLEYEFIVQGAREKLFRSLREVVLELLKEHDIDYMLIEGPLMEFVKDQILSILILEDGRRVFYHFKQFGISNRIDNGFLQKILEATNADDYRYVSLVADYAYVEQFNHDDNVQDPSRGTPVISIRDFFVHFFGEQEYVEFKHFEEALTSRIKDYFSYSVVKTLAPNVLHSFRNSLLSSLEQCPFEELLIDSGCVLEHHEIEDLKQYFFGESYVRALVGPNDFSKSFITAEWMTHSMKEARNVDLTAIAMGYFKSIEQFLYQIAMLHKNEGKTITRKRDSVQSTKYIELSDENLQTGSIDLMLNSLIGFAGYNPGLYRRNVGKEAITKIAAFLRQIKGLRNGYFHRDNLSDWTEVFQARNYARCAFFLLLGALNIRKDQEEALGIDRKTPYEKLCSYVNYNCRSPYYIERDGEPTICTIGQPDKDIRYDELGDAVFSGVRLKILNGVFPEPTIVSVADFSTLPGEDIRIAEDDKHVRIIKGEMSYAPDGVRFSGPQELIYDNGNFLVREVFDLDRY